MSICFYGNTDTVDIDAVSLGISCSAGLASRGLHIQIRHNREGHVFKVACSMIPIIVHALNEAIKAGEIEIPEEG